MTYYHVRPILLLDGEEAVLTNLMRSNVCEALLDLWYWRVVPEEDLDGLAYGWGLTLADLLTVGAIPVVRQEGDALEIWRWEPVHWQEIAEVCRVRLTGAETCDFVIEPPSPWLAESTQCLTGHSCQHILGSVRRYADRDKALKARMLRREWWHPSDAGWHGLSRLPVAIVPTRREKSEL